MPMLLHVEADYREGETLAALLQRVISDNEGLNQSVLAERSKVPLATLNAWIVGRRVPGNTTRTKNYLRSLAEHLPGVTVQELFEKVGQQVPGPLSADAEQRVVELYKNLSPGRQKLALQTLETLSVEERAKSAT